VIVFDSCIPSARQIAGNVLQLSIGFSGRLTEYERTASCWQYVRANYWARCWAPSPDYPDFPPADDEVVFLHGMYTRKGQRVLVHLDVTRREVGAVVFKYEVYYSDALLGKGTTFYGENEFRVEFGVSASTPIKLLAGQLDPNDSTKFSIGYFAGRSKGKIVGEFILIDNGLGSSQDGLRFRWGARGRLIYVH
jgi:hypothetical protein